jgi:hypothetical protein
MGSSGRRRLSQGYGSHLLTVQNEHVVIFWRLAKCALYSSIVAIPIPLPLPDTWQVQVACAMLMEGDESKSTVICVI